MANFWDELASEIAAALSRKLPPANMHKIRKAVRDLRVLAGQQSSTESEQFMSNPTEPTDLRSISQSVLDGIGNAVESSVAALKKIIANGNLQPADLTIANQAVEDLEALEVPVTPPVDTPPSSDPSTP